MIKNGINVYKICTYVNRQQQPRIMYTQPYFDICLEIVLFLFILWCFTSLQNHITFAEVTWRGVGRVADPLGIHALHSPSPPARMLRQPFLYVCSSARLSLTTLPSSPMHHRWDLVRFSPPFDVDKSHRGIFALLTTLEGSFAPPAASGNDARVRNPEKPESCNDQAQTDLMWWLLSFMSSRPSEPLTASVCDHDCRAHPRLQHLKVIWPVKLLHRTSNLALKPCRVLSITPSLLHVLHTSSHRWGPPHPPVPTQRFIFYSKSGERILASASMGPAGLAVCGLGLVSQRVNQSSLIIADERLSGFIDDKVSRC